MNEQSSLKLTNFRCHNLGAINLALMPGETISISGDSGSGKSLLLRAIADLIPHQGECYLNGQRSDSIPAHEWRKRVAYFAAESQWWFDTIGEHFDLPLSIQLEKYLEAIGFSASSKLDNVLDWDVMRCSTGERQRLAIIRLLANTPTVLLLDEPTANLDAENTKRVETIFKTYQQDSNCSIIWVSHDIEQRKRIASKQYQIKNKALLEGKA